MLKKDESISSEKTIIWVLFNKIFDKLLVGKKPPDEITVIAMFKELKFLTPIKFRMI